MTITVAPLAGAWIEIEMVDDFDVDIEVAPLAGAWIEIMARTRPSQSMLSLPSRERGLKYFHIGSPFFNKCRSPRGSVD